MKKTIFAFLLFSAPLLLCAQPEPNQGESLNYKIITGQFEKGEAEQQDAYRQLFGPDETLYKFDLYFHWYNVAHEYAHCILDYYGKSVGGVHEEILANKFAVKYWKSVGCIDELATLEKLLNDRLSLFPNPVPKGKTLEGWYTEIWGSSKMMNAAVYGYLQFKGVLIAMDDSDDLASWFTEVGIDGFSKPTNYDSVKYPIEAASAAKVLNDLQKYMQKSGLNIPAVGLELIDDPMTHCSKKVE